MSVKQTKSNLPGPGPGRPKGVPNKTTALLKDAILLAATNAGDGDMAEYLTKQAKENPTAFMGLLGKVLPMQVVGDPDNPLKMITVVELVAPDGNGKD
jgi:hypothetical protein